MFNPFERAKILGAEVILWGQTDDPHTHVVLLRMARYPQWHIFKFDATDGGFHSGTPIADYRAAVSAFSIHAKASLTAT